MSEPTVNDLSWMVGGAQGSGVDLSARLFALACANGGLWVIGKREYYSNIKGKHSYYQVSVDQDELRSPNPDLHLLAAYDNETVVRHVFSDELVDGGGVLYDASIADKSIGSVPTLDRRVLDEVGAYLDDQGVGDTVQDLLDAQAKDRDLELFPFDYDAVLEAAAEELEVEEPGTLSIVKNVVAVAGSMALLEYPLDAIYATLEQIFAAKSERIVEMNKVAAKHGYRATEDLADRVPHRMEPIGLPDGARRLFLQGTDLVGMAKVLAGCRFQTYYPITPATDESEYLEAHPDYGVLVVQCEDEISAITMAVGAALAGARASTSTSGPGFNLMVEGIGWAGINEVPVVVFDYQRGGPSVGMPTRHEQGDLKFALSLGNSEFPRLVLAPGDLHECFHDTIDAFNWAEAYQLPTIFLCDKLLANTTMTIDAFDPSTARVERGKMLSDDEMAELVSAAEGDGADGTVAYGDGRMKRYALTDDGISPRPVHGQKGGIHWATGDEHDERGHITEDPVIRNRMMEKRQAKLDRAAAEIPTERQATRYGPEQADVSFISWGSTKGAILDAIDTLDEEHGVTANFLQVRVLSPFPTEAVAAFLDGAEHSFGVEMNFSGQLCDVIRERTGIAVDTRILKYNGRPITRRELVTSVLDATEKAREKVVLTHGV